MENILFRDKNYIHNCGIYEPGSRLILEINRIIDFDIQISLRRLIFNEISSSAEFELMQEFEIWHPCNNNDNEREITLKSNLDDGYYILLFIIKNYEYAVDVVINSKKNSGIAIIKPTFTQWAYHSKGFYPSQESRPEKYCNFLLDKLKMKGNFYSITERLIRMAITVLGLNRRLLRIFPANKSINLNDFYEQNKRYAGRWSEIFCDYIPFNGLWCDEIAITFPIYVLLNKNKIEYDVYSDIDVHNLNNSLKKYDLIIFYGQEGITTGYYNYIRELSLTYKIPMLLLGIQGFGYRQYAYDSSSGELKYLCTRGKSGMWGDEIEDNSPCWGNEGELFGFQFPEPDPYWGYNQFPEHSPEYSTIRVKNSDHWLIQESGIKEDCLSYFIKSKDEILPGLTFFGGEIQKKYADDAIVIANLDDEDDVIGIGEYGNFMIFSPTYWPIFALHQTGKHYEIEKILITAINHYL